MTHILIESAWWLFITEINAAAWFGVSCYIAVCWMISDAARRLFR
jgi:hypothetical protein